MDKKWIENNIMKAYELIGNAGIVENGSLSKTFRGYISTFGAAITMGSLRSAIAFYSEKGEASKEREKLMLIIYALLDNKTYSEAEQLKVKLGKSPLIEYVDKAKNERAAKREICNAAIAIKLAMNLYNLV